MTIQEIKDAVQHNFETAPAETTERYTWFTMVRELGSLTLGNITAHTYQVNKRLVYAQYDESRNVYQQVLTMLDGAIA